MELDRDSSARLNLLRFPLIVGVVFIHAYESSIQFGSTSAELSPTGFFTTLIRDFISGGLASITVPLFFFMSGFLFFYNLDWSSHNYLKKLKTRIKTLLLPFLLWNIFYLAIIALAQNIPLISTYFAGGIPHIIDSGVLEYINLIIGIDRHPIGFQFWYVRDLIIIIVLTPVFHLMHKRTAFIFLAIFFAIWFSGIWPANILSIVPSATTVFFFYAGTVLAIKKKTPFMFDKYNSLLISICLVAFITEALLHGQTAVQPWLHRIGMVFGIFATFSVTKYLLKREKLKILFLWLGMSSFFVFAFHEPLMSFIQRLVLKQYVPSNDILILFFYFAIPIVVICTSVLIYKYLNKLLPKFTQIITGSRSHL